MAPPIDELVVLSGKGGTGKTTIAACLAALADEVALVDADVDAANLHLLLDPCPRERRPFIGGQVAVVDPRRCLGCGLCADDCRFDAIHLEDAAHPDAPSASVGVVDPAACEGCGVCVDTCPEGAAALVAHHSGHWFIADTELGPFTHARLNPGGRNSGGLVARVRDEGRALGRIEDRGIVITDAPPGIGCPAIAALTGADRVLLVTEPTLSGLHDLRRIVVLAHQLGVPAAVCINKTDLNPALTAQLAVDASYLGVPVLGRVRYDTAVVEAQRAGTRVTEYAPHGPAAADIRELWRRVHAWVVGDACMAGLQARQSTASSDTEHQGDER
jgi:MinD superfamily P-loop ATPase